MNNKRKNKIHESLATVERERERESLFSNR